MTIQDVRVTPLGTRELLEADAAKRWTSLLSDDFVTPVAVEAQPARAPVRERVRVENVAFDALTEEQVVTHVTNALREATGGCIITPNVDILRRARAPELGDLIARSELIVADGMPIIWASRAQRQPLPERVTGSALAWSLSRAAAQTGRSIFLLGGAEGTADAAAERLVAETPDLRLAGTHCPPLGFELEPAKLASAIQAVVDAAPDIVFVALGFPKQEKMMMLLREVLPRTWFIGCGGALAMVAGEVVRAPVWAQQSGLEWAHRLVREPRRLARRYLVDGLPFAAGMLLRSTIRRAPESP